MHYQLDTISFLRCDFSFNSGLINMQKKIITIWDLGTRLFHWLLVMLFGLSWLSAELGGNWMIWHTRLGFLAAGLITFRIIWGFIGSDSSRFAHFVKRPSTVIAYLKGGGQRAYNTHNPAGALSVIALIGLMSLQVTTGLFSNDDIFIEGPLAYLISYDAQLEMTELHEMIFNLLILFIALHVAAIAWYQRFKGEKLVQAMLHGKKESEEAAPKIRGGLPLFAASLAGAAVSALLFWI
jgi:cytochrome b